MAKKTSRAVPTHVAIIPDGNRRWAKKHGLKPWEGHFKGIGDTIEEVGRTAFDEGVTYLTIWGGSYDNLTKRSKTEIRMLNEAYRRFARRILEDNEIREREIRVQFIGEWREALEKKTVELLERVEQETKSHKKSFLTILAAYNGDREMLYAIQKLIKEGKKQVTPAALKSHLWTKELPPPDLVVRTGGEERISAGFMMWEIGYAELYFSPKMWPDFKKEDFLKALDNFSKRERRFGK